MKRYEEFVHESGKGTIFEGSKGTSEELIAKAQNIVSKNVYFKPTALSSVSVYTDKDGNKAIIPFGWTVSGLEEENTIWGYNKGLVIYKIPKEEVNDINWSNKQDLKILQEGYDQYVWAPVGKLDCNGTLDGKHFTEKFGRRNFLDDIFSPMEFNEPLEDELISQVESFKKYDGFFISRYDISKNSEGNPKSVKGAMPWVGISFDESKKIAFNMEEDEVVKSHLTYGAEFDSVLEWFIKTKSRTLREIVIDSTDWGNHWNTENSPRARVATGSHETWCTNNIYDFSGNVDEWTQERNNNLYRVIRGTAGFINNFGCPVAYRSYVNEKWTSKGLGFRSVLCIK